MKKFLLKYKWALVGLAFGVLAGFLYWYYIGCNSGSCPIQSNWHTSSLYGGLLGFLFGDIFRKKEKKEDKTV
ncbi:DUF6132 family protein [Gaoshiqia sp. Z1-71]|uniref:DUF6132 family protein n=1 Tax=Gaoshiqia hydrogeniformans TaxID=3290090 RepID=UPI003BF8AE80